MMSNPENRILTLLYSSGQTLLSKPGKRQAAIVTKQRALQTQFYEYGIGIFTQLDSYQGEGDELWLLMEPTLEQADTITMVAHGIEHCYFANSHPSAAVTEQNIALCEAAGIAVIHGNHDAIKALNRGLYHLIRYKRPWISSLLAMAPDGTINPTIPYDKTGFFAHWAKRFDVLFIPAEHRGNPLERMFNTVYVAQDSHGLTLSQGQEKRQLAEIPSSQFTTWLAQWSMEKGFSEICLDGLPTLTQEVKAQAMIDESRTLLNGETGSQYHPLGSAMMQTTAYEVAS
ncbi:hypothetical protein CS022_21535 [Veronia nyctiphanis]|uniref:Uncharacterized protein n=1 Tax=Veronia nyctiphanis TaxID=1278244 RepID=A0A4Q0YLH4_9GAMM|nr:hypothetical protein [Veronia nyctiphanis]RXJ71245.1 hypothetical protein CS022_21535 [Veronia nyctiphanis]